MEKSIKNILNKLQKEIKILKKEVKKAQSLKDKDYKNVNYYIDTMSKLKNAREDFRLVLSYSRSLKEKMKPDLKVFELERAELIILKEVLPSAHFAIERNAKRLKEQNNRFAEKIIQFAESIKSPT